MSRKSRNRKRNRLPLLEQFRLYFNEYRGAGIEIIGDFKGAIIIRYYDGHEVPIGDVLTWTELFDKFNEMHPKA